MNLTSRPNLCAVWASSGISRLHGSQVEYQKLMTNGLPTHRELEIVVPFSVRTSTLGRSNPTTTSFVESCGYGTSPGEVMCASTLVFD